MLCIFWAKLYKIVDLWGKNTLSHKSRKIHWNLLDHMQMILNFYNALHFTFRHLTLREYAWLHCAHLQDKEFTLKVTFALPIFYFNKRLFQLFRSTIFLRKITRKISRVLKIQRLQIWQHFESLVLAEVEAEKIKRLCVFRCWSKITILIPHRIIWTEQFDKVVMILTKRLGG